MKCWTKKKQRKEKKYGFFLNSSSGKKLALMAFSKTVSEDLMHVSLIFNLGSSTFHKNHCEILRVVISGSVVCWKGLCSETMTDLKLRIANQTQKRDWKKKKKNTMLRSQHFVSVHTCITSGPSLISLSKNSLIGFLKSASSWQHGRRREEDCLSTRWRHSFRLGPCPPFPLHHQLLAVVDLLIDAATETHWKSPGNGPMTWTYALFFMHVVVPNCTLPHSYIQHHWKHSMLCAKNDLKTLGHWGCMTCQRLHEIDNIFCTLLRVLKRSRQTPLLK